MKRSAYLIAVAALGASLLFSGCFIFRPKNKCDTCPSFSHKKKRH